MKPTATNETTKLPTRNPQQKETVKFAKKNKRKTRGRCRALKRIDLATSSAQLSSHWSRVPRVPDWTFPSEI